MAIINNVAYSWSMITLASTALEIDEGSTTLEGVSGIKWNKKRKIESNYGMGGRPVSRGFGNLTYTASITMDYATQQMLRSTYGSIFSEDAMESQQDDTNITHEYDLNPFDITIG